MRIDPYSSSQSPFLDPDGQTKKTPANDAAPKVPTSAVVSIFAANTQASATTVSDAKAASDMVGDTNGLLTSNSQTAFAAHRSLDAQSVAALLA